MTLLKSVAGQVTKVSFKVPLGTLLVVPFVLEIFAAVGLTGWLSLRNGRQAVNEFTSQFRYELGDRIHQKLRNYLEVDACTMSSKPYKLKRRTTLLSSWTYSQLP